MTHAPDSIATEWMAKVSRLRNAVLPRYVFIHINKTAGSSIERALKLRFEHKTALEKRRELGAWRWNRAFKFSFVRNPWDKVASHYHYRVKTNQTGMGDGHISFRAWVLRAYGERDPKYMDQPLMFAPQHYWLEDGHGTLLVDLVGRFETLHADFEQVCARTGVSASLPHLKQSANTQYRSLYDQDARECIRRVFSRDIDLFGYQF